MKSSVNLTIIFCATALVMAAGVAGGVILTIFDKDATAFYGFFATAFVSIIGFGGLVYGQNNANTKLDTIKTNVNGNLEKLIAIAAGKAQTRAEYGEVERIAERTGVPIPTNDEVQP